MNGNDPVLDMWRAARDNAIENEDYDAAREIEAGMLRIQQERGERMARGVTRGVVSGATFGLGEEIESALSGQPAQEIRQEQAQFRRESPVLAFGSEAAGAVPLGLLTGAGLLKYGGQAGKALTAPTMAGGAALGTLEGAAYGAGMAPPGERGKGAAIGAGAGALGGAIGGPLVGALTRRFAPGMTAERMLEKEIASDLGSRPTSIDYAELAYRAQQEPQRTLAELSGPAAEMQAASIYTMGGPAREIVEAAVEPRRATSSSRLIEALGENIGTRESYRGAYNRLGAQARTDARPLYQAAYEADFSPDEELVALASTPKRQRLLRQGYERARESAEIREGEALPEWKEAIEDGFENIDLRTWDHIKRGLDAQYQSVVRRDPSRASDILSLKRQVVGKLDELGPEEYRQARAAWAGPKAQEDALDAGKTVLKEDAATTADMVAEMSQAEKEAYAIGAAQVIRDKLKSVPPEGGMPRWTDLMRERMEAAFPDQSSFNAFWDAITSERDMQRFRNLFKGQSMTAQFQAGQERQQRLLGAGRGVAEMISGQPLEGARTIAGQMMPRRQTIPENVTAPLARMLMSQGPEVLDVTRRLQRPPVTPRLLGPVTTTEAALLMNMPLSER